MTVVEPPLTRPVDEVLALIGCARDISELEMAWSDGLLLRADAGERDRILVAAGSRLRAFGDEFDDHARRTWLRQVAEERQSRRGQALEGQLAAITAGEAREAFAYAGAAIAELRDARSAGEQVHDFAKRSPVAAMRARDLGRIAKRLRGSDTMKLVSTEDVELVVEFAGALASRGRLLETVPESMRVRRDDLLRWAESDGSAELPRLLSRLISETLDAERIDFPAGTGVAAPGSDGIVECAVGNRFVPDGTSVWEVSTQRSKTDAKAREDYAKRVAGTPSEDRRDNAYAAVVCAPWTKHQEFEREMAHRRDFREVRALNVDDLEAWLGCAPSTTAWLRDQIGRPVSGVGLLSAWWAKWLESTSPRLDEGVVLAGRDVHARKLRERCQQHRGGVITVGGDFHCEEILAFVAAALVSKRSASPSADVLYVDERDAARRLLAAEARVGSASAHRGAVAMTIVVPSADFAELLPAASQHRLIVPVPGSSQADLVLDAVDATMVTEHLRGLDIEFHAAERLGGLARISLLALRRNLAVKPELHMPAWAVGAVDQTLRRSLLLNMWDQTREGDCQAVKQLVGRCSEEVAEALHGYGSDAAIVLTDELWHVVSPPDAWMLLDGKLTRGDLEAFGEIALEVLTDVDPLNEMTVAERLSGLHNGVRARYSKQIKTGIAITLALLGSRPLKLQGAPTAKSKAADEIVWPILRSAQDDDTPRKWTAVSEVLPLLAEAAPEAVLASLRDCLHQPHPFAKAMFADGAAGGFGFSAESPHLRILEALEIMAWSPEYLMAAVDLLACLAVIDPGGTFSNRPASSLASILCPWHPNTAAGTEDRMKAVNTLRDRHSDVAWTVMLSMLPSNRDIQITNQSPSYREWSHGRQPVTSQEYADTLREVARMLVGDVGADADRWAELTDNAAGLSQEARADMVAALAAVIDAGPGEVFKSRVWPELNALVNRHRQYRSAAWSPPDAELREMDGLLERLRPSLSSEVYGELFSSGLMFVDGVSASDGYEPFRQAVEAKQADAVQEIFDAGGMAAAWDFATQVELSRNVGIALARIHDNLDSEMADAARDGAETVTQVVLGYFGRRFGDIGWEGVERLLEVHAESPRTAATLMRAIAPIHQPWKRVASLGSEVEAEYWSRVTYYDIGIPEDLDDLLEVSRRLRESARFDLAIKLLALGSSRHESEAEFAQEAACCLEQQLQRPETQAVPHTQMDCFGIVTLVTALEQHRDLLGVRRVAEIEWQYNPLLRRDLEFTTPNLYRAMARDPEFFVSLVELAYRRASASSSDRPSPSEERQERARNAYSVLTSWAASSFDAAVDEAGRIDARALNDWVDRARGLLAEIDRIDIGDTSIGQALEACRSDADGEWPSRGVRDVIERLKSRQLDNGFRTAVFNRRGMTSRSVTCGGGQERALAHRYREQSRRLSEWPRTAAIFKSLAQRYEYEAELEDREAESSRRNLPV